MEQRFLKGAELEMCLEMWIEFQPIKQQKLELRIFQSEQENNKNHNVKDEIHRVNLKF